MPITIADVAARAGVSKTTVSRVLNGKGELDVATATRVRQVIDELGYVPSARAVGLARGRTRIVGMLVPSLTWPWIGDVLQGAVDVLESESYGLLLFTCNRGEESMRQFATQVSAKSFDGLLVIEPEDTLDYIADLHERGLPVVLIDDRGHQPQFPVGRHHQPRRRQRRPPGTCLRSAAPGRWWSPASSASAAPRSAWTASPRCYAEAGHRRSTRAWSSRATSPSTAAGTRSSRRSPPASSSTPSSPTTTSPRSAPCRPRARSGRRVPDDIAVVGFDDVPAAAHTEPPLTTVRQPLREMGATAAQHAADPLRRHTHAPRAQRHPHPPGGPRLPTDASGDLTA